MRFYLGTHLPTWLWRMDVPLFVSHVKLRDRKSTFPRATAPWALDSGAFSEVAAHGHFLTKPGVYAKAVKRYQEELGGMEWCAPQDWMCEPFVLAKTRYSIADHQRMTVDNFLELRGFGIPVVPVLQGWTLDDYYRCLDLYRTNSVDLTKQERVGLGSVCRRQNTSAIEEVVVAMRHEGLALHGFGMKTGGLKAAGWALASADSLAWSFGARYQPPLEGHEHKSCANCPEWALRWRKHVLRQLDEQQTALAVGAR